MKFLNRLERKFGRYAIPNLINYILIGYGIGYVIQLLNSNLYELLTLDPEAVMHGQVWRLFTWVLTVPQSLDLFILFMFLFYYWIGHTLENYWGTFRYNMYMISGYLIMTLGAMVIYWVTLLSSGGEYGVSLSMSTYYMNLASFLAFATLFPNEQIYFMMILPIKIKWLAIVDAIYLGYQCLYYIAAYFQAAGNAATLAMIEATYGYTKLDLANMYFSQAIGIVLSVLNFLIFFFATRNVKKYSPKEMHRKHTYRRKVNQAQGIAKHKCAICGRTSETNPELTFRFCSKCEGNYEYCQDHIFTHQHFQLK
jgi:hypothetical protein